MSVVGKKTLLIVVFILLSITMLLVADSLSEYKKITAVNVHSNSNNLLLIEKKYLLRIELFNQTDEAIPKPTSEMLLPLVATSNNQNTQVLVHGQPVFSNKSRYTLLSFPDVAPFGYSSLDVHLKVTSSTVPLEEKINRDDYLLAAPGLNIHAPEITNKSAELVRNRKSNAGKIKAIFDWVTREIKYTGYQPQNLGALHTLKTRKGDCTEFSYLTVALLRTAGIPARIAVGFVATDTNHLKAKDLHNWVEVYQDNRWQILDPQNNNYLPDYSDYIQLGLVNESRPDSGVLRYPKNRLIVRF